MDPMEKVTPDARAGPFLAAHLKSLEEYPPRQAADTLSIKIAVDGAMKKLESPGGSSN
jgi:hypothetical protein